MSKGSPGLLFVENGHFVRTQTPEFVQTMRHGSDRGFINSDAERFFGLALMMQLEEKMR